MAQISTRQGANVALALVILIVAANARAEQVERTSNSEAAMERPSSRAVTTAFVPRLGKRDEATSANLMCANSPDCSRLALLGALVSGVPLDTSSPLLHLAGQQADFGPLDSLAEVDQQLATPSQAPSLLELVLARQQHRRLPSLARQTRASEAGAQLVGSSMDFGSTKRVAFTPRIGR